MLKTGDPPMQGSGNSNALAPMAPGNGTGSIVSNAPAKSRDHRSAATAAAEADAACASFRRRAQRQGCAPGAAALSSDCSECARFRSGSGAGVDRREWQRGCSACNFWPSAAASSRRQRRSFIEVYADEAFRAAGEGQRRHHLQLCSAVNNPARWFAPENRELPALGLNCR